MPTREMAVKADASPSPLTVRAKVRYKSAMRSNRPMLLRWGAIVALALLALAAAPHFHDAADGRDDTCVPCHVQGAPLVALSAHDDPDPAVADAPPEHVRGSARKAEIEGRGSRAPPA